ncbi:GNAT family N-acetyltransferase [Winogradskyella maritima]|nr:GNAT family N-acetyltransferase [Winogradskyella maritima]
MPFSLQEIGRQREVTFREIGEGTNNSIDIDEFDAYYHHMFLWDNEAKVIAGLIEWGWGHKFFPNMVLTDFIFKTSLGLSRSFFNDEPVIEMGRAYIMKEYQQKPMPLFLLWKGIVHTTLRHPEHKYLLEGLVSVISFPIFLSP